MTKSIAAAQLDLSHFFQNANIPNLGDATGLRGSTTPGDLYIVLFTDDPTTAGSANTNEASYAGYGRVAVARSAVQWQLGAANSISNLLPITFPQNVGSSQTVTHFGITDQASGASVLHHYGEFSTPVVVVTGMAPNFIPGVLVIKA